MTTLERMLVEEEIKLNDWKDALICWGECNEYDGVIEIRDKDGGLTDEWELSEFKWYIKSVLSRNEIANIYHDLEFAHVCSLSEFMRGEIFE